MGGFSEALVLLLEGFRAIGDALVIFFQALLTALGLQLPDVLIRLIMLLLISQPPTCWLSS